MCPGRKYLDAWCVYFWATTPVLISILTFTTYSLMGNKLTAAKVNIVIKAMVCYELDAVSSTVVRVGENVL